MPRMKTNAVSAKPKNIKKTISKLLKYIKSFVPLVVMSIILIIVSTVFRLFGPNKLQEMTNIISDSVLKGISYEMSEIISIGIFLIILYAVGFVCTYFANLLMGMVSFKMGKNLRRDISKKINNVPLKFLDKTPYGDVLSCVTNDVDTIGQTLHQSVAGLVGAIVLFLGSLIMMFVTNWIMAFAAIGSTIIGFAIMFLIIAKSQKYFVEQQNRLGDLNGVVEEVYSGQTVVKTYNASHEVTQRFEDVNKKLYKAAWKSQFISGIMQPIMSFVGNLGYVVVCVVGAVFVIQGKIDLGVITAFMIYIRYFTNPLAQIAQSMTSVQTATAAAERVFNFLKEDEFSDESEKNISLPEKIKGNVKIKNVKFGYDENREIIHGFSADIKAGQKVAIVGPTGAGKTTIVNLLMRFYEINSGKITIDGISINDMTRGQLRDIFSMVLQDTWLFEGTIRENLIYNKSGITDEDLDRVCKACGLDHFIKTLSHGYDTVLSDETNVSVGQKQLLTIARAMLQNSPMLILDEATSNVDTRTEVLIQKAMDKLTQGRTSFVIAHRLSTIKNADLILVLKDGDVIESGNHKELIKKKGFYADLYNSQFSLSGTEVIE